MSYEFGHEKTGGRLKLLPSNDLRNIAILCRGGSGKSGGDWRIAPFNLLRYGALGGRGSEYPPRLKGD